MRDLVLVNGSVLTMDAAHPRASGVAIRTGKVVAVGTDSEVRAACRPDAEIIDLAGRTATPGFNDAHAHPMSVGFALADLNLASPPNTSIADLLQLVRERSLTSSPSDWIVGRGYDQARLDEQRHPRREDLDTVAPNHPVILIRACHHIGVANSAALAIAGIDQRTPDPEGGTIDRDEHGVPTGVLRETALELVRSRIAPPSEDAMVEALRLGGQAFLEQGITSAVEAGIHNATELRSYQRLWRDGQLPIRTYLMMIIDETLDELIDLGVQTGFGDPWLRIGPAKLFSDGSIGGHTARMRTPYVGTSDNTGLWMQEPEIMTEKIVRAHQAGFQIGIHAIGDAAIDLILDSYEQAQQAFPRPDPRHRIEHCSIVDEETIKRIARLGVIPIPGTSFLYYFRDAYVQNLGIERLRYAYGMATFLQHGVIAAASSDAPVVPTSATVGLQTMLTREDMQGDPIWREERISLLNAIQAYTLNGAIASFEEGIKGSLAVGKVGDIAVFECDLESVAEREIGAVQVDFTIADGEVAYARA